MSRTHRLAVLIDGANLSATANKLGLRINFDALRQYFEERYTTTLFYYFTAVPTGDDDIKITPLIDWLSYNGYVLITKPIKNYVSETGERTTKGNMDVEITIRALALAPHIDELVLCSGDGDFASLIEALQAQGVFVSVLSSTKTSTTADEMRRQPNRFIELDDLRKHIAQPERSPTAQPR